MARKRALYKAGLNSEAAIAIVGGSRDAADRRDVP